jgi:hypothetical protein
MTAEITIYSDDLPTDEELEREAELIGDERLDFLQRQLSNGNLKARRRVRSRTMRVRKPTFASELRAAILEAREEAEEAEKVAEKQLRSRANELPEQ